jgi:hypothetical protein
MARRWLLGIIPVGAVLIFAFIHSGSRAQALCERDGFSATGTVSVWPPGARCRGGDPPIRHTVFDAPSFFLMITALALLSLGAAAIADRRAA